MDAFLNVGGVAMPRLIYGTAWKEGHTAELTAQALAAGFVGIDTANQRKHYYEAGVGEALAQTTRPRDQLFVQTKFTYVRGQDQRLPYDPKAPVATQVQQSFESSLAHLGVTYLDSYVLHGPESSQGLTTTDAEAWGAMEALQRAGRARMIGVSNVSRAQLAALCELARVSPAVVQNRCHARTGWDEDVRTFCRERGIAYQGFSLLTANTRELAAPAISAIAKRLDATVPQLVFRFAMELGMAVLTGTSSKTHLAQDLAAQALQITVDDIAVLQRSGRAAAPARG